MSAPLLAVRDVKTYYGNIVALNEHPAEYEKLRRHRELIPNMVPPSRMNLAENRTPWACGAL